MIFFFLSDDKCVIIGSKRGEEMNQTVEYIKGLTAIASPTGFTREISDYLVKTLEGFGYQPVRTAKGGVNVTIKGQMMKNHRYVTAHVDTLGAHCPRCQTRRPSQIGPYRWFPGI